MVEAVQLHREEMRGTTHELPLAVLLSMLQRGVAMDVEEQNLLRLVLDRIFAMADPAAWDEPLEQAYFKLYGEWPVDPPWFVKKDGLPWR